MPPALLSRRGRLRAITAALGALTVAVAVTGCASDDGGSGGDNPSNFSLLTPAENAIVRNEFTALAKGECATAEKAMPLKTETVAQAEAVQKVTLLAGQNALPVMFVAGTAQVKPDGDLGKNNLIVDYEKTLKDLGVWDNILPGAAQTVKSVYGQMSSLPFQYNIEGIFYNKKLFADQGVQAPKTWGELVTAAQKFKGAGVTPITEAGNQGWPITRLIGMHIFRSLGPDAMKAIKDKQAKLTDPAYVAAAQAIADLGKQGLFGEGITSRDTDTANTQFLTGKAAMMYNGSWFLANLNDPKQNQIGVENVGFIPFPTVDGGKGNADQWPANAGAPTAMSQKAYSAKAGDWLKCVAENYGSNVMQNQGVISGFKLNKEVSNVPPLTKQLQDVVAKADQTVLWFEALWDAKTTKDAQTNVALLVSGQMSPQQYMSALQADLDQAR